MTIDSMFNQLKEKGYVEQEVETDDAKRYNIGDISEATGLQKTASGWVKPKGQEKSGTEKTNSSQNAKSETSNSNNSEKSKSKKSSSTITPQKFTSETELNNNGKKGDFIVFSSGDVGVKTRAGIAIAKSEDRLKQIYEKLKMKVPDIKGSNSKPTKPSAPAKTENKKREYVPVGTVNPFYAGTSKNSV